MSTTVVPAPAAKATRPVRNKKLAKDAEKQAAEAAQEKDERVAKDEDQEEVVVAKAEGEEKEAPVSETSLAADFSFDGALAEAAASAGSLSTEGEVGEDVDLTYAQYDDEDGGAGGTILLIGAIALVGLGIVALASGGDDDFDTPVPPPPPPPPNTAPTITVEGDLDNVDEDDADGVVFTVTTDDAEDDDVTVTATSDDGTVTDNGDGTFTFVPDPDFNGDATITFTADDGTTTTTSTQTITVNAVNDAPTITATGDVDDIDEDDADGVVITVTTTDPEGDDVTVTATSDDGTVTDNGDGTFTFVPDENFNGEATVTFTADDGTDTTTTDFTVTVNPVDDDITGDETLEVETDEDAALTGMLTIVDPDGDDVTFDLDEDVENGTLVLNDDGTFTYTPDDDFNGDDSFVVTGTSADGSTFTQTVNITVNPVNDAPVAGPDNDTMLTVANDETVSFVIDFDDVDGDDLTATIADEPDNGVLIPNDDGTVTYDPDDDFVGTDTFDISVTDGIDTVTYTVTVEVTEGDGGAETISIDVPASGPAVVVELDDDTDYVLTDSVGTRTDVFITASDDGDDGFNEGDLIAVTGADEGDYSFGTSAADPNDLQITFNDGVNFTQIILDDVLTGGFVFDYDSAVQSVGFEFMTFG